MDYAKVNVLMKSELTEMWSEDNSDVKERETDNKVGLEISEGHVNTWLVD